MALPRLPTSALQMSPPTTSRIPHLLLAITSKGAQPPLPSTPPRRHASTKRPILAPRPPPPSTIDSASSSSSSSSPLTRPMKPYLWAIGLFGATTGLYLSYYLASYRASQRHASTTLGLAPNANVSDRWNDRTRDYDEEIAFSEAAMFMGRKRRRLLGGAAVGGRVLEVSCGTGRNFAWYDFDAEREGRIEELVFNDQSAVQLGIARGKWEELQAERGKKKKKKKKKKGGGGTGGAFEGRGQGVVGDAGVRGVIKRPAAGFDTIVQTMGVCSMADPVGFLRQMNYLLRQPGEGVRDDKRDEDEGGRILLLEHGRGHYEWINRFLDNGAVMHADRYGCWFNKDINAVLRESGLKVEYVKRYHLGTTWEVVLRPNPELLRKEDVPVNTFVSGNAREKSKSWWSWS